MRFLKLKLKPFWLPQGRKLSPLKTELKNLNRAIERTQAKIDRLASGYRGVCCPSCGIDGFDDLCSKNERRQIRIKQIEAKLARDTGGKRKRVEL